MPGQFNREDYIDVDSRITKFWEMHPKPEGSIQTAIIWVAEDGNAVAIRATVYQGDRILANGIAHEERGKSKTDGANFTSWWENAETSAIGRALANMDMSLSKRRPSRQEMEKVQRYEEVCDPPARIPPTDIARQMPQDAPDALTDAQERVIAEARDMAEQATPYPAIVNHLRPLQADANPDQWTTIRRALKAIKDAHYQKEA